MSEETIRRETVKLQHRDLFPSTVVMLAVCDRLLSRDQPISSLAIKRMRATLVCSPDGYYRWDIASRLLELAEAMDIADGVDSLLARGDYRGWLRTFVGDMEMGWGREGRDLPLTQSDEEALRRIAS